MTEQTLGTVPLAPMARPWPTVRRVAAAWSASTAAQRSVIGALAGAHALAASTLAASTPVDPLAIVALIATGIVSAAAAGVDLVEYRLPNTLVGAVASIVAVLVIVRPAYGPEALAGASIVGLGLIAVRLVRSSLGMGDVKFGAALGAVVGVVGPTNALALLVVAPGAAAFAGMVTGRDRLAFGPWLSLGAAASVAVGDELIHLLAAVAR